MNSFTSVLINALPHHDGVVVKNASFRNKTFPSHFHTEWSLGMVIEGSEAFDSQGFQFNISKGTPVLIPPYSVHANAGTEDVFCQYSAMYLQDSLMQWCFKQLGLNHEKLSQQAYFISQDNRVISLFHQLSNDLHAADSFEKNLLQLLNLWLTNGNSENSFDKFNKGHLSEIIHYLHQTHQQKVTLTDLSDQFRIDKFKLLRLFKSTVGISPLEYQTSLRVETSKRRLLQGQSLQDICFETGFYDLSHFSHTFKKFTGVSPQVYKKSCNILQAEALATF